MRAVVVVVTAALASGCPRAAPTAPPTPGATVPVPPPAKQCLPVVAAECGCVYSCALGTAVGDRWAVTHPFWTTPITATVRPYCVDGQCTDAFHGEIVCSGICAPRPADPTCHLDPTGACVGGAV